MRQHNPSESGSIALQKHIDQPMRRRKGEGWFRDRWRHVRGKGEGRGHYQGIERDKIWVFQENHKYRGTMERNRESGRERQRIHPPIIVTTIWAPITDFKFDPSFLSCFCLFLFVRVVKHLRGGRGRGGEEEGLRSSFFGAS
jgi:hypothetical protein